MDELIYKRTVIDILENARNVFPQNDQIDCAIASIKNMPTVEPTYGEWIIKRDEFCTSFDMYYAECSNCKYTDSIWVVDRLKYCPNCGAKMGDDKDVGTD